jgi:hypothetical protein
MAISLNGCDGGVLIGWSEVLDPRFHHYTTLRSGNPDIPVAYPPQNGAVDFGTSYASKSSAVSGFDVSAPAGATSYYRTMAFDASGAVVATSGVASVVAKPVQTMGPLAVAPDAAGTRFTWTPYAGGGECFTFYKLSYTIDGTPPSYLAGDPTLLSSGDRSQATYVSADLQSGTTYTFRLEVIRGTDTGNFVVAHTDVVSYTVP